MNKLTVLTVLMTASLAAATAVSADPPKVMNMPGMQMSGAPSAQKMGHTTGKVVQVDDAHSRITINHHPVPALGWPAMTMTFEATASQLKDIKTGDQVDFQFAMHGRKAVIERIHKIG